MSDEQQRPGRWDAREQREAWERAWVAYENDLMSPTQIAATAGLDVDRVNRLLDMATLSASGLPQYQDTDEAELQAFMRAMEELAARRQG